MKTLLIPGEVTGSENGGVQVKIETLKGPQIVALSLAGCRPDVPPMQGDVSTVLYAGMWYEHRLHCVECKTQFCDRAFERLS